MLSLRRASELRTELDGSIPPRLLLAPLVVLSPGSRLAVTPSAGKERMKRLNRSQRFCGYKMALDGSRWQVLGRSPIRLAPRDAIDNEFFRWLTKLSSLSMTGSSTMVLCRRDRPIGGEQ
jgi:hypothetical protein